MKKLLTSILTVLAISTNAFAAEGDADKLAGLVLGIIGLVAIIFGIIIGAYVLSFIVLLIAAIFNTVVILPIVFLINTIFKKSYEYFSFTRWTAEKIEYFFDEIRR